METRDDRELPDREHLLNQPKGATVSPPQGDTIGEAISSSLEEKRMPGRSYMPPKPTELPLPAEQINSIRADQIMAGTFTTSAGLEICPEPGDVWAISSETCYTEDVFVQKRSRFFSWLYRSPQYWVTHAGSRVSWLEEGHAFLWRRYSSRGRT